jgi:hypothetical protein
MLVSLAFDRAVWGLSAPLHHLHSLGWHLVAVIAAMLLVERRLGHGASLVVGLVFGLHPVQSEVVAFVSARNDALAVALGLCGALVLDRAALGFGRLVAGAALFFLAMCAKEIAVVGALAWIVVGRPPAALACDAPARREVDASWPRALAILAAVALFGALRLHAVGASAPPGGGGWEMLAEKAPAVLAHYAALVVIPWPLSDAVTLVYLPRGPRNIAVGLAAAGASGLLVWRGGRAAAVGLVLAALLFAPVLPAIASKKLLADRYMYAPMLGIAVSVAAALPRGRLARGIAMAWVPIAALLVGLRLPAWESSLTLAEASAVATPSAYAEAWLGIELLRTGRSAEAAAHVEAALSALPPYCAVGPHAVASEQDPARAVALGQLVYDRGCAGVANFREEWALAHVLAGDLERAGRIMEPRPACDAGATPARVALALALDGEEAGVDCASSSAASRVLIGQAAARLGRMGN